MPLKRVLIYVESIRNTIWIQWMIWCVAISFHDFFDSFFFFSILLLLLLYFVLNELVEISNRSRKLFNYFLLPHRIRRISLFKIRYRKSRIQFTAFFFFFSFIQWKKFLSWTKCWRSTKIIPDLGSDPFGISCRSEYSNANNVLIISIILLSLINYHNYSRLSAGDQWSCSLYDVTHTSFLFLFSININLMLPTMNERNWK